MRKWNNFTAERIASFKCPTGRQQSIYWDGKTPGLGLRVTAKGAKSYIFETRLHGKTIRLTIGDVRTWAVAKAQDEATSLKTLTDKGIDPRQLKMEQAARIEAERMEAKRSDLTVTAAWNAYLEARRAKWSARHLANHEKLTEPGGKPRGRGRRPGESALTVSGPLFPLLARRLAEIDADTVREWLEQETATRPTWAAQAYRALRAFLAWAADQRAYAGIAHADACNRRMARDVLPKAKAKTDALQREQLAAWFAAVRAIGNPVISAYLQVLLLTGSRREELAGLRWDDVDFRWQAITIHDKVEGERTIPMTPYVASLLANLKQLNDTPRAVKMVRGKVLPVDKRWRPSPWVFSSSTSESGRLQEPRIQHRKACAIAAIDRLTIHGLRRSFKSLSEWTEMPVGIVAQIMGHKPSATAEKHYSVRPLDLLRMWHSRYEAWILKEAGIKFKKMRQGKARPALKAVA
jgi:integrase